MSTTRSPSEIRRPRMALLAQLPVFLTLDGKRAVVAGDATHIAWKVELLSAAGAAVSVFAEDVKEQLQAISADPPGGPVTLHARCWQSADFAAASIAVGAFVDVVEAERFATSARRAGVPVNIIDKPQFCDFTFGAIVNRSPLVIGISTDGAAPMFGMAIRTKLEAVIPAGFALWAKAAQNWRRLLKASRLNLAGRRHFWRNFVGHALAHPDETPERSQFDTILAATRKERPSESKGAVVLVGAGPGNPELLTLRGLRALQCADVILVDDLVTPEILEFARREAEKILVGKTGHRPSCKQDDVTDLMISLAKSGRQVVRLKSGDPMIFGRASEEIAACRAAGIPVEVVPGITSAQGAASSLGLSLTQRRRARRLQFVTGHGDNGRLPDDINWHAVADPSATTVIYMPVRTLEEFCTAAVRHGLDRHTPAAAISHATRSDECIVTGTVGDLPARLAANPLPAPVIVLIGRALEEAEAFSASEASAVDGSPYPALPFRDATLTVCEAGTETVPVLCDLTDSRSAPGRSGFFPRAKD
ncbi:siroheme synthase CysG [Xanthobacteraceae bacterium Astr-EGSB]|uniref:siroheme synthase CysG n=1 Tax=Astrobacterium formosum TaxID=3069710 RepID=UPI0027AE5875|nr:siroheme synthase CysG [Xanthobacteraceae bacterium Astr-EGSB]